MPPGRPARGARLHPTYTLNVEISKKKSATVELALEAEASRAAGHHARAGRICRELIREIGDVA